MANSKLSLCVAGVSALLLSAAHAQVVIEDTAKPGNSGDLQTAQSTAQTTDVRRESTPPATSAQSQTGTSTAGATASDPATVSVRSAGAKGGAERRLQRDTLQGSERQTGTVKSGMVEGARFAPPQAAPVQAAPVTQYGASLAGDMQSSRPVSDSSNVPATDDRSQTAQDAAAGVTQETMQGTSGAQGATAAGAGELTKADSKAIMDMAMANMAEVEMGKMAQEKGSSEQVKTFGQQMIDDHGKALAELQALAQAKGVSLPMELDAKHRKEANKLEKLSGAAFDRTYMARAGVRDHKAVHAKLSKIESQASDPDVKALASKMKPVVHQHLNSAQQMSKAKNTSKPDTESGNR